MHKFHDNTAGVVSSPGTNDFTSFTDSGQFDSFTDLPNGEYAYIAKPASNKDGWELGEGVWDGTTLTRRTVYTSSNGGSKVNFSGKIIVYITATSDMLERAGIDPFKYKADDEPIAIFVTGQSNALQIWASRVTEEYNPNIFDWATDGIRLAGTGTVTGSPAVWDAPPEQDPAKFEWRQVDPNAASYVISPDDIPQTLGDYGEDQDPLQIYTGHTRGGAGGIAWGLADRLEKATGRKVYMLCVARGAEPISSWGTGGDMRTEINTQATNALAALTALHPGVTFFDAHVWMQGEQDATIATPAVEYADAWVDYHDWFDTNFGDDYKTRRFICDTNQRNIGLAAWEGLRYAHQKSLDRTVMLPSNNKEIIDFFHFHGDQHTKYGEEIARAIVFGPDPVLRPEDVFIPNDQFEDIVYTTYTYDGASASRPALTVFRGYYNHDAGDTTLRINHTPTLLGGTQYIGDIKSGDTVTFTKDASNYEVWTCSSDGTFTNDTDGGYWSFSASVVRTGTISIGDDVTLTTSAQHFRDVVDYITSNKGGKIGIGFDQGDTLPDAAFSVVVPDGVTGAFKFFSPDKSTEFTSQVLNIGAASFTSSGTLSFGASSNAVTVTLTSTEIRASTLTGVGSRTVTAGANGAVETLSTVMHSSEIVAVPSGTSYTNTSTFPILDGEMVSLRAKVSAKRTDGGAVGAMSGWFTCIVHRSGTTYTTSGVTMTTTGLTSIGTGSTLDMQVSATGGVISPTCSQQSGETWAWVIDWENLTG